MPCPVVVEYNTAVERVEIYCQMVPAKSPEVLTVYAVYPIQLVNGVRTLIVTQMVSEPKHIPIDDVILIKSLNQKEHTDYSVMLSKVCKIH